MKTPSGLVFAALLLLLIGAGAGYAAASIGDDDPEPEVAAEAAEPEADSKEWLYVLLAGEGSLEPSGDGFELSLSDVHDQAVAFTDRPDRISAHMELDALLGLWDEGGTFADDPPNAELEMATEDGSKELVTLELLSVTAGDVVTFEASVVSGAEVSEGKTFPAATLFIDDVSIPPACATFQGDDSLACQRGWYTGYQQGLVESDTDPYGNTYCASQGQSSSACKVGYKLGYFTGENNAS